MQLDPRRPSVLPGAPGAPLPRAVIEDPEPPKPGPRLTQAPIAEPESTPAPPMTDPPADTPSESVKPTAAQVEKAMEILARADAASGGMGDPVLAASRAKPAAPADSHVEYRVPGLPTITRIPRGTRLTISMLPHRREVVSSVEVYGEYTPSLDPGKYAFKLIRVIDPPACSIVWCIRGEFLVNVTEEQYRRLVRLRPKLAKGITTTDGSRWVCGFVGCGMRFTSPVQIIQHEGEHFGRDFLHEPDDIGFDDALREVNEKALEHGRMLQSQRVKQPYAPLQPGAYPQG